MPETPSATPPAVNAGLPPWTRRLIAGIDRWTDKTGHLVMLTFIPMILGGTYEVVARYAFDAPTSWATDVTFMANGTMYMLGAAYALLKGAHVRTDMFYDRFSDRAKGMIDLVTYLVFFLPVMAVVFFISVDDALRAYQLQERSNAGLWQPILWPFRAVIPLTAVLLFAQGISEMLKSLWAVRTCRLYEQHEKIEV
jgi:TRAP-type mannitol/chloroaromatic compound transport system permease small subunit